MTQENPVKLPVASMISNIMDICIKNRLPLTLQHTAIVFLKRAVRKIKKDENILKFLNDEAYFVECCVSLALKAENMSRPCSLMSEDYEDASGNHEEKEDERKNICEDKSEGECMLSELIDFDFHVPCPYLRVLSMLIILQERGILNVDPEGRIIQSENYENRNYEELKGSEIGCNDYKKEEKTCNNKKLAPSLSDNRICMERNKRQIVFIDDLWNNAVCNIQKFLLYDDYLEFTILEIATAAIEIELVNVGALDLKREFREDSVAVLKSRR